MERIKLEYSHEGQIARLCLDSPKANILDLKMMEEISWVFNQALAKEELKLIVLSGAGKHFSFGASVEEHTREMAAEMISRFHSLILQISVSNIPVLSKITGFCLGGALELVLASHVIFAEKNAQFGQPEVNLSVFPPPASLLLPLKLGYARAEEIVITGENFSAEKGEKMGLINRVLETPEELDSYTENWIEKNILGKSAVALRYATKASRLFLNAQLQEFLPHLERIYVSELMETHDANEGISAFLEKRKPIWQNN